MGQSDQDHGVSLVCSTAFHAFPHLAGTDIATSSKKFKKASSPTMRGVGSNTWMRLLRSRRRLVVALLCAGVVAWVFRDKMESEVSRVKNALHAATGPPDVAVRNQQEQGIHRRNAAAVVELPQGGDGGVNAWSPLPSFKSEGDIHQHTQGGERNEWLHQPAAAAPPAPPPPPPPPCPTPSQAERSVREATATSGNAAALPKEWLKPRWRLLIFGNQRVDSLSRLCESLKRAVVNETVAVNFYLEAGQPEEM